jgi:hypothetical protein
MVLGRLPPEALPLLPLELLPPPQAATDSNRPAVDSATTARRERGILIPASPDI